MIISHSQDFLNGVCTNIIHMHKQKLVYYGVRKKIKKLKIGIPVYILLTTNYCDTAIVEKGKGRLSLHMSQMA